MKVINRDRNRKSYHNNPKYREEQQYRSSKYMIENDYYTKWCENNRDKIKEYNQKHKEYHRLWNQQQRRENIQFRLKDSIRSRIYQSVLNKSDSSRDILGCSIEEYVVYLGRMFDKNMSWDNYGTYWEVDHIKPISSFNLTKDDEVKDCFNYKNTQPLSVDENRKKGNK
tara:strand:+ start:212 stop:718 length:507 start_codon:yes stop_codon:yes gene_type:complete